MTDTPRVGNGINPVDQDKHSKGKNDLPAAGYVHFVDSDGNGTIDDVLGSVPGDPGIGASCTAVPPPSSGYQQKCIFYASLSFSQHGDFNLGSQIFGSAQEITAKHLIGRNLKAVEDYQQAVHQYRSANPSKPISAMNVLDAADKAGLVDFLPADIRRDAATHAQRIMAQLVSDSADNMAIEVSTQFTSAARALALTGEALRIKGPDGQTITSLAEVRDIVYNTLVETKPQLAEQFLAAADRAIAGNQKPAADATATER